MLKYEDLILNLTFSSTISELDVSKAMSTEDYDDDVWCLTVQNSNFLARRNGKAFFTGNCWYKQKGDIGLVVGEELQNALPNYHHLGEWEGTLPVSGVKIMLFHANDGTAYANSYKGQKLVESLDQEKPQLIFEGHYHKSLYQYVRRIHQWESGTICGQTGWMRGKKIQAHVGFWRIEVEHVKGKVIGVESKWYCTHKAFKY